ncbi:hypothetical protein [Vulcanisaeta distributa]|uniref:hypothetical protein n=1 Tax=Vulcanisaeta distributa TaxID=164451 RepID=UPI000AE24799|nr:hypothetical protein [Vulcanisaeta distributa]
MIIDIAQLIVRLRAYWVSIRGLKEFIEDYPFDEIALKALKGRGAVYPFGGEVATYGSALLGSGGFTIRGGDFQGLRPWITQ